jgi:hypothetical protein
LTHSLYVFLNYFKSGGTYVPPFFVHQLQGGTFFVPLIETSVAMKSGVFFVNHYQALFLVVLRLNQKMEGASCLLEYHYLALFLVVLGLNKKMAGASIVSSSSRIDPKDGRSILLTRLPLSSIVSSSSGTEPKDGRSFLLTRIQAIFIAADRFSACYLV